MRLHDSIHSLFKLFYFYSAVQFINPFQLWSEARRQRSGMEQWKRIEMNAGGWNDGIPFIFKRVECNEMHGMKLKLNVNGGIHSYSTLLTFYI